MESMHPPPVVAAAAGDGKKQLHIAMFPWLAFGHMIPFLELSKLIAQKGHRISYISTPRNIHRLPKLPQDLSPLITFVKLPLPRIENLPENAEATTDLTYEDVKYLKIAYDGLAKPLTQFLKSSSPDWVFFDFIPYWLPGIARELNISSSFFSIFTVSSLAFHGPTDALMGIVKSERTKPEDYTVKPSWIPFETSMGFRMFEILRTFEEAMVGDDEDVSTLYRFGASIAGCDLITARSCADFEGEWFELLAQIHGKPVLPVGFLPVSAAAAAADKVNDDKWSEIKEWLDKQMRKSVVYIAFGSEAILNQQQLTEIACGLELSGLPFFWVIRKNSEQLPIGFEERTKGRGIVWTSWAPQTMILSHDSVGGLITHAGWSTVVEAVQFGKPFVFLTFWADQPLNAKLFEEKKMGYPIPRDELDGSFTRDSVAESLNLVMVHEEGRAYRDTVKEMSSVFGDMNRQDVCVNNLLIYLESHLKT